MNSRCILVLGLAIAGPLFTQTPTSAQAPTEQAPAEQAPDAPDAAASTGEEAAEGASAEQNARQHYRQGTAFFDGQRYAEAAAEFEEAYRLYPNVVILYALGQAYEGTLQVHKAIEAYRQYLESAPPDDERRADVESRIQLLERLLATIHVDSNVPAELFVDGESRGQVPGDVEVSTGRHELALRAEGYAPSEQTVIVAAGTEHTVTFELTEARVVTEREIIRVGEEPTRIPRAVFWTSIGATAGAGVAWVALASIAKRRVNQYDDMTVRTPSARDDAQQWNVRADILLGVTGGLAALSLTLGFFTDFHPHDDGDASQAGLRFIGGHAVPGGAVLDLGGAL
jgi:tetratricopeptide (TPR) repeat protein